MLRGLIARLLPATGSALRQAAGRLRGHLSQAPTRIERGRAEPSDLTVAAHPEAINARDRAMRIALESTGDGVLVLSPDERISYLNGHAQALIAHGRNLIGTPFWEVFPEIVGGKFWDALRRCKTGRRPDGADGFDPQLGRHLEGRLFPAEDGSVTVFFRDVTEQRRAGSER